MKRRGDTSNAIQHRKELALCVQTFADAQGALKFTVPRVLSRACLRLPREACVPPGIKSALRCPDILKGALTRFLRQTGARGFVWSSAVDDDGFVLGKARNILIKGIHQDANRVGQLLTRFRPGLWVARVDEGELLPGFHSSPQLIDDILRVEHTRLLPIGRHY